MLLKDVSNKQSHFFFYNIILVRINVVIHLIVVALNFVFNLQNGGGKSYIHPDEVLDRVASILGTKCNGFPAEFGGDSDEAIASRASEAIIEVFDFPPFPEVAQGSSAVVTGGDCGGDNGGGSYTPNNYIFNTPKSASTDSS